MMSRLQPLADKCLNTFDASTSRPSQHNRGARASRVCNQWRKTGRCSFGSKCLYYHSLIDEEEGNNAEEEKEKEEAKAAEPVEEPTETPRSELRASAAAFHPRPHFSHNGNNDNNDVANHNHHHTELLQHNALHQHEAIERLRALRNANKNSNITTDPLRHFSPVMPPSTTRLHLVPQHSSAIPGDNAAVMHHTYPHNKNNNNNDSRDTAAAHLLRVLARQQEFLQVQLNTLCMLSVQAQQQQQQQQQQQWYVREQQLHLPLPPHQHPLPQPAAAVPTRLADACGAAGRMMNEAAVAIPVWDEHKNSLRFVPRYISPFVAANLAASENTNQQQME